MATFPTPVTARPYWRDMPGDDAVTQLYLEVATVSCLAYAPALDPEDTEPLDPQDEESDLVQSIPAHYFLAIVTQARNLKNAGVAPVQGGDFDGSGYGVTVYPLDWSVKQMLRPERGLGAII